MLLPVSTDQQIELYEDESLDVDSDEPSELARAADGFIFAPHSIRSLPAKQAPSFSDPAIIQANIFYGEWLWGEIKHFRTMGYSIAEALKRVDLVKPGTALKDGRSDQGWGAYRTLVLTLFGRPGGIMAQVKDVMHRHRATPMDAWRSARDQNRVSQLITSRAYSQELKH